MSKAAQLMVKCLENEGVSVVFGLPGEENIRFVQALAVLESIRYVLTRHEQAAAFMAEMYGRVTGRAAVVSATLGPGAINMQLGVADATTNSTPMVAISAQVGQDREYKESHQYVDLVSMFAPITRWAAGVPTARAIPEMFRKAFKVAETERPAAVYLAVPEHIDADDADYDLTPVAAQRRPRRGAGARSGGTRGRHPAQRASGRWCWPGTAPPAPTPPRRWSGSPRNSASRSPTPSTARASCPTTTPTASGPSGSCGTTTSTSGSTTPTSSSRSATSCRNSTQSGSTRRPTRRSSTSTASRPRSTRTTRSTSASSATSATRWTRSTDALAGHAYEADPEVPGSGLLAEEFARGQQDSRYPLAPQRVVADTRAALGRSDVVLVDTGATKMWMARLYPTYERNTCLISNGLSTMGFALPGALGVKLARPESKVLAVVGDGAFLMNSQEIETAVRERIPLVVLIWEDGGYGLIEWKMDLELGEHYYVKFGNPDIVKYAESFGAKGYRINSADGAAADAAGRARRRRRVADLLPGRLLREPAADRPARRAGRDAVASTAPAQPVGGTVVCCSVIGETYWPTSVRCHHARSRRSSAGVVKRYW